MATERSSRRELADDARDQELCTLHDRLERAEADAREAWSRARVLAGDTLRAAELQADVARLREALRRHVCCAFFTEAERTLLAATEPSAARTAR